MAYVKRMKKESFFVHRKRGRIFICMFCPCMLPNGMYAYNASSVFLCLAAGLFFGFFMHTRYAGTRHLPYVEYFLQFILAHQAVFQYQLL